MIQIGDEVWDRAGHLGVVIAVDVALVTVRWDDGDEVIPLACLRGRTVLCPTCG